jgi:hypothetical protein
MKQLHVECLPDELLVSKLGFTRKMVTHHQGKSRIFHCLKKSKNQLAIVDEDPGSTKDSYEMTLKIIEEFEGIRYYQDKAGNKVFFLKGKLEDWIISACKNHNTKLSSFKLPEKPNDLHNIINYRLNDFSKLIDELIKKKNPAIMKLRAWLN